MDMSELDTEAIRAEIAALDTLPSVARLAAMRRLALEVLPAVLNATNWPSLQLVKRERDRMLVRCSHCGQDHWRSESGTWVAAQAIRTFEQDGT